MHSSVTIFRSFPRKRESTSFGTNVSARHPIPAFAGMSVERSSLPFFSTHGTETTCE